MSTLKNKRTLNTVSLITLVVISVLGLNLIINYTLSRARVDFTQNGLYSLSQGTKKTLGRLEEPIKIRFYFSDILRKQVPTYATYGQRITNLIEEYVSLSGGKISFELINPEPFSESEDRAVSYGLKSVPLDAEGSAVYFGLVGTNSVDGQEVIPFLHNDRERFIEYDLTKMIYTLANPKKPVVGLLSQINFDGPAGYPGQQNDPWIILDQVKQFLDVRTLEPNTVEIPEDISVLMLVHPTDLSAKTLYAIDQFALRGGKLLAFVDPHSEIGAQKALGRQMGGGGGSRSDLKKLFDAWGVELVENKVVGDVRNARRVNAGTQDSPMAAPYLPYITLRDNFINRDESITGDLEVINLSSAGILKKKEGSTIDFIPLFTSSPEAMQIEVSKIQMMPDIRGLLDDFKPENTSFVMAARLSGTIKSAFPEGAPKDEPKKDEDQKDKDSNASDAKQSSYSKEHVNTSKTPLNAVIVADTDILDNRSWVQVQNFLGQNITMPTANNADFVVNTLEMLTGSGDLIGLRSRGTSDRPFTAVNEIKAEAERHFRDQEKALQTKLSETQEKLQKLQSGNEGEAENRKLPEQEAAIKAFREELVATRKQLRDVKHALRKDISRLESIIEFINIAFVPILIILFAFFFSFRRIKQTSK